TKPDKRFAYAPTANANDELRTLKTEMDRAEVEQIAFFAPNSYAQATKSLAKAEGLQQKGSGNAKILEELGTARSFFEQARSVADRSLQAMPDVAEARERALIAGAAKYNRPDLIKVDKDLKDITKDFERKNPQVSLKDRNKLQTRYSNIELQSIKTTRLGDVAANIEAATKMGASRYAPRTLGEAKSKHRSAELTIKADRHNDALISAAQEDALQESRKLVRVTEISRRSGQAGNETLALDVYNRDEQINALTNRMSSTQSQLTEAQRSAAESERSALSAQEELESQRSADAIILAAQEQFSPQEAEIFRQGNNLILRLKSLSFTSGRSEIPASAFATLNKVKNAIQQTNAQKVVVEGHTDATGSEEINKKISQERAESVAKYLQGAVSEGMTGSSTTGGATDMIEENVPQIEAQGYGFEHPLANNKTKAGRAQNRRVDIVIMTSASEAAQ
ncbi:MAG: OmpA family protein, partial [Pseudobdellovibrionaceae bacterium]